MVGIVAFVVGYLMGAGSVWLTWWVNNKNY